MIFFRENLTKIFSRRDNILMTLAFLALVILFTSSYFSISFGFYPSSGGRIEILAIGIIVFFLVFLAKSFTWNDKSGLAILCLVQLFCVFSFLSYLDGRLIYSDDHPNFIYRLQLLREHFPQIPFYNPRWNAGYSSHEFYPTGVINIFFAAWPILYLVGDFNSVSGAVAYNYIIAYVFLGLIPLATYWAARLFLLSPVVALIAGVLALMPSMGYFEWVMRYGTLGFGFSLGLLPLVFALFYRLGFVEDSNRGKWFYVFALFAIFSLAFRWTPFALMLIPLALYFLLNIKRVFSNTNYTFWLVLALLLFTANVKWVWDFIELSKVGNFVSGNTLPGAHAKSFYSGSLVNTSDNVLQRSWSVFKAMGVKVNPLIYLFLIPGLCLLPDKHQRRALGLSVVYLLFLAAFGEQWKPQLELRRMILAASFLAILPVSLALVEFCKKLLELRKNKILTLNICATVAFIFLLGFIAIVPLVTASAYTNRSDEAFRFSDSLVDNLSAAVHRWSGKGRTFILGFILHDLNASDYSSQDGGHVSPLAIFSGRPFYASDYYHRRWSTVDPIPADYRARGEEGIEEFLDLVNTTAVITFRKEWVDYCKQRSWYKQVFQQGRFRLFRRTRNTGGPVLSGVGKVKETPSSIIVSPETQELVVKYRYYDRLRVFNSVSGVEIYPVFAFKSDTGKNTTEDISFIGLRLTAEALAAKPNIEIGF
ncbi:MAG: hypothetical protein IT292_01135 [Deltaproteobacteria bacterium]|nr:hypothetical protein [Deltaproteobacteria bacterium]